MTTAPALVAPSVSAVPGATLSRGPVRRLSRRFPSIAHGSTLVPAVLDLAQPPPACLGERNPDRVRIVVNRRRQLFTSQEQDRNAGSSYSRRTSHLLNRHTFG